MIGKIIGGSLLALGLAYGGYKVGNELGYKAGFEVGYKQGREEVKVEANKRLEKAYNEGKELVVQYGGKLKVVIEDLEKQANEFIDKALLENRVQ